MSVFMAFHTLKLCKKTASENHGAAISEMSEISVPAAEHLWYHRLVLLVISKLECGRDHPITATRSAGEGTHSDTVQ